MKRGGRERSAGGRRLGGGGGGGRSRGVLRALAACLPGGEVLLAQAVGHHLLVAVLPVAGVVAGRAPLDLAAAPLLVVEEAEPLGAVRALASGGGAGLLAAALGGRGLLPRGLGLGHLVLAPRLRARLCPARKGA